jgi:hypothetical protein
MEGMIAIFQQINSSIIKTSRLQLKTKVMQHSRFPDASLK